MKKSYFLSKFSSFISARDLPLWVVKRSKGIHPSLLFHSHNYSEIAIITEGRGIHLLENQSVPIGTGAVLLIHPGAAHAYDRAEEMGIINLLFDPAHLQFPVLDGYTLPLLKKILPEPTTVGSSSVEPVMYLGGADLQVIVGMLKDLEDELKNIHPGKQLRCQALFMEILVFLARKSGTESDGQGVNILIGDAVSHINNHYAEPLKVKNLAKKANMSLRSFTRHFPQTVGCTPMEYLMKIRLQHASDLLINTDLTIAEIAWQCGFYDSNYFCKKFRQAFNDSPRKFRISFQSGKNNTGSGGTEK